VRAFLVSSFCAKDDVQIEATAILFNNIRTPENAGREKPK